MGIGGERDFGEAGAVMQRSCHFQKGGLWIRAVYVVTADDDVLKTLLAPLVGDVAGQFVVARGAGDVRFGGEDVMLAALFVGGGNGFEFVFDLGFVSGSRWRESEDGSLGCAGQACGEQK